MTNQDQIAEVKTAMKQTKNLRLFQRYQAVYLSLTGHKQADIAKMIGRSRPTLNHYISAYKTGGLQGLMSGKSTGKPKKLTLEQEKQLEMVIADHLPYEVGFENRMNWTLSLVAQYVKQEWGVTYSLKGISLVLKRIGLSFTRPTYTIEQADPEKQRQFKDDTFLTLKKN